LLTLAQLADLANLTQPFFFEATVLEGLKGLKGTPYDQLPVTLEDLQREYCKVSGLPYPIDGADYATSWMFFRVRLFPVSPVLIFDNGTHSWQSSCKGSQRAMRDGKHPQKRRLNKGPCSRHWV
jgi:hypothetical protein